MLSIRLVELIESNWEEIARRLIRALKDNPHIKELSRQPDLELREWCQEILQNLGYLLLAKQDEEISRRFEVLGKIRFEEKVPLHEAVLRIQLLKNEIINFIHEQGFQMSAVQIYAEEELEQRIGRLFDAAVFHVVCGYEAGFRTAQKLAAGRGRRGYNVTGDVSPLR